MADQAPRKFVLWPYTPSLPAACAATAVFGLLTVAHGFRLVKSRTWFCIPFFIGGLFETIGYVGRAMAHSDTVTITPYVMQSLLILLAPILFAASIYMILGRLIVRTGADKYSLIRPRWITRIFVAGDVFCFLMQSSGGGMLASAKNQDNVKMGEKIILGGLMLQILIFGFFVVVACVFHARLAGRPTPASMEVSWQKYMWVLYLVSILITVRNACRVVEYAMGRDGFLVLHEWPLYIYDCIFMTITLALCLMWYVPNIQPGKEIRPTSVEMGFIPK